MSVQQLTQTFTRATLPYLFAEPANSPEAAPLVVFLHGGKDRGHDLDKLLAWGFPKVVAEAHTLPYYWLALQIPEDNTWPQWQSELLELIDALSEQHNIDRERVVLTGFSLGSAGVWQIGSDHPDRFAGLVVVSGSVPAAVDALALARLKNTPLRVFHGGRDDKVQPAPASAAVATLKALGADAQFTLIANGDHFIADEVYGGAELQKWLAEIAPVNKVEIAE